MAQSASRRSSFSEGRNASASASWTGASVGKPERRHISSTEAKALLMRADTMREGRSAHHGERLVHPDGEAE